VLKVEVRLHAFYFLDGLQKCSYVVGDETPEPDGCIVELTKVHAPPPLPPPYCPPTTSKKGIGGGS
jgi:hypothetical protein